MLEKARYINHLGESVLFGQDGIFVNESNLRNYEWQYDTGRRKAEYFRKGIVTKTVPIVIVTNSKEERASIKNTMYEVFEKDVIANEHGKLYIGDFYTECKVYGSETNGYLQSDTAMNIDLYIISDTGIWYRNIVSEFRYAEQENNEFGHGYPYGYNYDYVASSGCSSEIINEYFTPGDFILTIYGYAMNPEINISGHVYKMNCTIQEGEKLTINSISKTILLTKTNDIVVNMFSKGDKENYIFEKIPAGISAVYWNGNFDFDINIRVERGEPLWM